jgi:TetR/AcrR family transcriptional regulator
VAARASSCEKRGILALGSKAQVTRAAILSAAEDQFAQRGYVATRLEDVAAAVGLKRAALFYHFRDKQSLYDAVIADAFGQLASALQEAFAVPSPVSVRIERAVEVWVDTIAKRPTIARLILRHAAEAEEHTTPGIFPGAERLLGTAWSLFEQGRASGELNPVNDDLFHAASAVLGATIFYVSALSSLLPNARFNPLAPEQVEAHKRDALRTVRMLLGIRAGRKGKRPASAAPSHGANGSSALAAGDGRR